MPELPDVEVFRRYVNNTALHKKIKETHVAKSRVLKKGLSPQKIRNFCKGQKIEGAKRFGKYVFLEVSGQDRELALHFGMTGYLLYQKKEEDLPKHSLLTLIFSDDSRLSLVMPRKFGAIELESGLDEFRSKHHLGSDVLSLNRKNFVNLLKGKNASIKAALMDQSLMAGLGNIYSDEALFQAKIHPGSKISRLTDEQIGELWNKVQDVVKKAIQAKADPKKMPSHFLISKRKDGEKCPRCSGKIKKATIAGRSSYFCPSCQKRSGGSK